MLKVVVLSLKSQFNRAYRTVVGNSRGKYSEKLETVEEGSQKPTFRTLVLRRSE